MTSFYIEAARREIASRSEKDPMRLALQYLLDHAVGQENAQPGAQIANYIWTQTGHPWDKAKFQQVLVSESRAEGSDYFIGSCSKGFFLIATREDEQLMDDFYTDRIAKETSHRGNLRHCSSKANWPTPVELAPPTPVTFTESRPGVFNLNH